MRRTDRKTYLSEVLMLDAGYLILDVGYRVSSIQYRLTLIVAEAFG